MITFTNISLSFLGKKLLDDINFQLNSKEKIGLIGRNGSGKSTLLSLILNRLEPDDGKIIISKNYKIGLVEQKIEFNYETVLDEIISVLPDERYYESWKG
jgi:ATP-binding cassette subfamily F protein 3